MSLAPFASNHSDSSSDDPESDHGVGLSDPLLSQGRRHMLDLVNRLHSTGVQIDIDLPQIAVIGIQSAGKSSLIESISGITLPRAAGTCMRCPTECRLSRSDTPRNCTVELRFISDKKGQPLGQAHNESFGHPIFDKAAVEDRIRRVQRAILNPSKPVRSFLDDAEDDSTEISFSTTYISLQISGPEVADLSLCVSRGGNGRDIAMVENLVASYISKPSCVILLTVACESTTMARHLTKKYDPEGKRTIAISSSSYTIILTIARSPRGDEENWLPLIRNEQETLENNWYCVKQPSSRDLKQGNDFFCLTPPWSELDHLYQKYLRTSNLTDRLSSILSHLICKRDSRCSLPQIQIELETTVQKTRANLAQLPKPPSSDPVGEIAALLHGFVGELYKILEGVPRADGLLQIIRPAQEQFRRAIRTTAPDFRPFEAPAEGLDTSRTRELLPCHYPFVVQKSFIAEFTSKWALPAMVLCRFVYNTLAQHVKALITLHFSSFGQGGLEQRIMILVQDYMKQRAEAAQALISKLIWLEEDGSHTLNEHYLADYKAKFVSHYKTAREKAQNPGDRTVLSGLAALGLNDVAIAARPDDPALNIMSDVRAYFQVAYKRLVRGLGRELLSTLYRGLGVNCPEGLRICRELAQESPNVAGKREELLKRLERLETASRELVTVGL
ncbi:P-loop containing nucleoside triphosphate hydrolase protein [Mycena leptocephala]|nr:P-loop containing nucleoside triphosphate hydrolase protein [Mycena leptocephala]